MTSLEQAREVIRWCRQLAKLSEDRNAITRTFLSKPMRDVHTALAAWMARVGMTVRVDAIGNIRGVYPPRLSPVPVAASPRFYIGSHLDTVPNAGAFDGVLGTVLAIALVELLEEKRFPFAIEVVGFSDEEGVRFGVPFLGSRALAGTFDTALLDRLDAAGRSLRDAIRHFGLDPNRIPDAQAPANALGYLEFHIEQGPVLENLNLPLAVVDVISGQSRAELTFDGVAGHAGTTPMKMRKDALACAAAWIAEVEREALTTSGLVATVGRIAVEPGAGNVVPGRAVASLDVRHPADRMREAAVERLSKAADGDRNPPRIDGDVGTTPRPAVGRNGSGRRGDARSRARAVGGCRPTECRAAPDTMRWFSPRRCRPACCSSAAREASAIIHAENVREDDVAAALDAGLKFLNELETRSS